jgi:hypothetical protein
MNGYQNYTSAQEYYIYIYFYSILQYENRTRTKIFTLRYYGTKKTDLFKDV